MQFVRASQFPRAGQCDGMAPASTALRGQQVVIPTTLVQMGPFGKTNPRAFEDQMRWPDQLLLRRRIFLQENAGKAVVPRPVVPLHIDEIFPTIVIVE